MDCKYFCSDLTDDKYDNNTENTYSYAPDTEAYPPQYDPAAQQPYNGEEAPHQEQYGYDYQTTPVDNNQYSDQLGYGDQPPPAETQPIAEDDADALDEGADRFDHRLSDSGPTNGQIKVSDLPHEEAKISVTDPTKVGGGMGGAHMTYKVCGEDKKGTFEVVRRYKEFLVFRALLSKRYPGFFIPPIPEKVVKNMNQKLIEERCYLLNRFLQQLS